MSSCRCFFPQAKLSAARSQLSERDAQVSELHGELRSAKAAVEAVEAALRERDDDGRALVGGLEAALEATRAALEGERARGQQRVQVGLGGRWGTCKKKGCLAGVQRSRYNVSGDGIGCTSTLLELLFHGWKAAQVG